ncbi:NADH-quinone oxidoreductase subunit NuoH [Ferroglobus sp.]|uniref:NADH-quinone oxidoreductase subunit NuoH n=1 Tax=Ferroglobus sp. TaxID=2614230 RepID=UPI0025BCF4D0|nr:NADH-quinone oxidoreductase subunit NuoH [Ferroglobus sp.]
MVDVSGIVSGIVEKIFAALTANMVNIPILEPLINKLLQIPLVNLVVAFILWKPAFVILFVPGLLAVTVVLLIMIWWERKLTARIQWRVGPKEVSRRTGGIIQTLADGMRYMFQEVIIHRDAHKLYFLQLPILSFIPVLLPILLIPAGTIYAIRSPYAIQIAVALTALLPIFILGIGWSANNRFAFIGTVREAFLYVAYEIPLMIAVLSMVLLYKSGDPFVIVEKQWIPGIFMNPIAFIAFLIGMVMAAGRLPFDISEADQEIAFGPFVEYSGIIFGLVMGIAYEKLYLLSLIAAILFFGGWSGPEIAFLGELSYAIWLFLKAFVLMGFIVMVRAIYGRYRLDQALKFGWSSLLTFSLIGFFISAGWVIWLG